MVRRSWRRDGKEIYKKTRIHVIAAVVFCPLSLLLFFSRFVAFAVIVS